MRSNKKLMEIYIEIYRELFKAAKPSADFDKLIKTKTVKKPRWFFRYYLPMDKQIEITEKVCNKYKLDKRDRKKIELELFLGCTPVSSKEAWKEYRKTSKKKRR